MIAFPVVGASCSNAAGARPGSRLAWRSSSLLAPLAWLLPRRIPRSTASSRGRRRALDRRDQDAGVLDLRDRHGALRTRRIGHRPLQRVDPRRARLRPGHLLSDPAVTAITGLAGNFAGGWLATRVPLGGSSPCRCSSSSSGSSRFLICRRWRTSWRGRPRWAWAAGW